MNSGTHHVIGLGDLPRDDPLYGYLQSHIIPQLGYDPETESHFRVSRFPHSSNVYLYEDKDKGLTLVGKFFKSHDPDRCRRAGENEFNNLLFLRRLGFSEAPHYIVRPFGFNPDMDNLVVTEYIKAESMTRVIKGALYDGKHKRLYKKLSALAWFLATLHNKTAGEDSVDFDESCRYMGQLLGSLSKRWGMDSDRSAEFRRLREMWRGKGCMWEDRCVMVHGDATPSNFLFGHGRDVICIDLERMKRADRLFDVGRLCGELKHFFLQATGDPHGAEPFIGHFLWEYCGWFPDRDSAFRSITRRLPFYIGITLLRIARNSWIDRQYRWHLVHEAKMNLRADL